MTRSEELLAMLAYRRPAGSKTERRFINRFILPLGVRQDARGNLYKLVGDTTTVWSSHTDTVHKEGGQQSLRVDGDIVSVPPVSRSNCLGADCTTGVWLMVQMIRAGKPGLYIFHREEETGGEGSYYIAKKTPGVLAGMQRAIAFDRLGKDSIITHQGRMRCASDTFAKELGRRLGLGMTPDPTGSFTDTANYTDLIGECTNISVGYLSQHTAKETQDLVFAERLLDALLELDAETLPSIRKPGEEDWDSYDARFGSGRGYSRGWSDPFMDDTWEDDLYPKSIIGIVKDYPELIADWLEENGISRANLIEEIRQRQSYEGWWKEEGKAA